MRHYCTSEGWNGSRIYVNHCYTSTGTWNLHRQAYAVGESRHLEILEQCIHALAMKGRGPASLEPFLCSTQFLWSRQDECPWCSWQKIVGSPEHWDIEIAKELSAISRLSDEQEFLAGIQPVAIDVAAKFIGARLVLRKFIGFRIRITH